MHDFLMRVPLVLWLLFAAMVQIFAFVEYVNTAAALDPSKVTMRLAVLLFLWLMAAMVILRTRPLAKAGGLEPRISALAGTFIIYGVGLFPRRDLSPGMEVVATMLVMVGIIAAIAALLQLGKSFSLMAESRKLITNGPYRFVRHPLYLAEEIAMLGVFLQFASIWTALLCAAQVAFQLRRMHNEELVLSRTFPEYAGYRQATCRLIPGIY